MSERTPIFNRFGQICSSRFLGICCYLLAEVVESDLLSLGRVFFIYGNDSNVRWLISEGTMI
jgi:hypothetical protein